MRTCHHAQPRMVGTPCCPLTSKANIRLQSHPPANIRLQSHHALYNHLDPPDHQVRTIGRWPTTRRCGRPFSLAAAGMATTTVMQEGQTPTTPTCTSHEAQNIFQEHSRISQDPGGSCNFSVDHAVMRSARPFPIPASPAMPSYPTCT